MNAEPLFVVRRPSPIAAHDLPGSPRTGADDANAGNGGSGVLPSGGAPPSPLASRRASNLIASFISSTMGVPSSPVRRSPSRSPARTPPRSPSPSGSRTPSPREKPPLLGGHNESIQSPSSRDKPRLVKANSDGGISTRDLFVSTAVLMVPDYEDLDQATVDNLKKSLETKIVSTETAIFLLGKALFIFPAEANKYEFKTLLSTENDLRSRLLTLIYALAADEKHSFLLHGDAFSLKPPEGNLKSRRAQ